MKDIKIAKYKTGDETAISEFIKKVYDEFVAGDYPDEGNQYFYDWIKPAKISERQVKDRTILLALSDPGIAGMIEIRDNNRISLLFVDKEFQGMGIAKKLFGEALEESLQKDPNLKKFFVHASPYSIPIYKKLGFIETDIMQESRGIKYLPMEMIIKKKY